MAMLSTLPHLSWLMEHVFGASAVIALVVYAGWILVRRPKQGQTSFVQPVRVLKLRQEFLSGKVTGIRFGFSNDQYAHEFELVNNFGISAGTVEWKKV